MADIQRIDSIPALDELIARSNQTPVWIFKHSLTCPVSSHAWSEFQRFAADSPADGPVCAVIEIQLARPVSNAVAERTGIRHESPQILLLREGRVAWQASHYGISREALRQA
ncbi:MAG: bacillithiol system redox-active protein YtxJ [Acidobacteria bacterium]|nr:bacillithiol system redox-active protein YtxJ [Acidobacteriota bacterium]